MYDVIIINQNGGKVVYLKNMCKYDAHKICRQNNNLLRVNNPHNYRKFVPVMTIGDNEDENVK